MKKLTTLFLIPMSVALLSGCGNADKVVPARNEGENVLFAEILDPNISMDLNKKSEKLSSEMVNLDLGKEVASVSVKGEHFLEITYNDGETAIYSLLSKTFVAEKSNYVQSDIEYINSFVAHVTATNSDSDIVLNKYVDLYGHVLLDNSNYVVWNFEVDEYIDGQQYVFIEYLNTENGQMHSRLIKYVEDNKIVSYEDVDYKGSKYSYSIGGNLTPRSLIDLDMYGCEGYKFYFDLSAFSRVYIYNSNNEVVKTYTLPFSVSNSFMFMADGKMFYQTVTPATSKEYDFLDDSGYFNLESGYLDILTGEGETVECNFVFDSLSYPLFDSKGRFKYAVCDVLFINSDGGLEPETQEFVVDVQGKLHNNTHGININTLIKIGNRYWDPITDDIYNAQLETLMVYSGIQPIVNSDYIVFNDFNGLYGIADKYFNVLLEAQFDSINSVGLKNGGLFVSKPTGELEAIKVHRGSYEVTNSYTGFDSANPISNFYCKLNYADSSYKVISLITGEEAPTQFIDFSNTTRYHKESLGQTDADYQKIGYENLSCYTDLAEGNKIINYYFNVYAD